MRRKKRISTLKPEQPMNCKECVWGEWDGTAQFCLFPECVKEKNGLKQDQVEDKNG